MNYRSIRRHLWSIGILPALLVFASQLGVRAEEPDNASARAFNAAAALQNAGLHTRASTRWSEFIATYPNDERVGRANYYLGVCRLREKKFDDAAKIFQTVLARWPNIPQADKAQYNLAMSRLEIASAANNPDAFRQAAKDFEVVASKYAKSDFVDDSLYYQGDCFFQAGDLDAAVSAFQRIVSQHANSPHAGRAYYDMGIAQQELGKLPEASKTFQAFLEKPEFATHQLAPEVRLRWAICLHGTDQLDAAAEQFDKAAQIPDFDLASYAAYRLGQTKQEQEKYDEAAKILNEFSKRFPKSEYRAEAMKSAGHCYFLAEKPNDAIRVLSPVANSNDPPAAEASYWLGRSQLKLKQADQALKTLEQAIGRFGDSPFAAQLKFVRINALYELPKRRGETPRLYDAFLGEHPNHALAPQAAYMAALSSFGQQQYGKARELAENYLANPEQGETEFAPDMKFIAAESILLENPNDAPSRVKAESLYRDLVAKHADHARGPQSHLRIGWCLQAADKPQDAINYLRGVLGKFNKQQQVPEAQWLIGRSHAMLDQHREAVNAFKESIAANGNWVQIDEVLLSSAESHRALNELDPATAQLRRLVESQPKSGLRPQALYALGEISQERKQHDQAINWFKQVAEQFPDTELAGPAMHALSAVFLAKQQYAEARQWASRLIDGKASDELKRRGRYLRGLAYHRENDFAKATEDLKAYRQQPVEEEEGINATYILALCQIGQKQLGPARSLLDELIKARPEFPHADKVYYELGHAWRGEEGKGAEAAAAFQWIAEKRPDSELAAESWFRVAQHQADVARSASDEQKNAAYKIAETWLSGGLAKAKDAGLRENMTYLLGEIQFQQQRFADSADTLSKQVSEFPNGKYAGPATFLAAQSRYQLQQFDQALPLFVKVVELPFHDTPDEQVQSYRSQSLYRAGDCAAKLNRWPESQTHFQKLVEQFQQFPQRAEASYGIAYALQQQNQLDRAIEIYNQVTGQSETETAAKARFMIGEIEFGRKRFEDAIEHFLVVTVGYSYPSWQALARFETARCFVELGDNDRAVTTLREMIEKHPDHVRASDAKKMLDDLTK